MDCVIGLQKCQAASQMHHLWLPDCARVHYSHYCHVVTLSSDCKSSQRFTPYGCCYYNWEELLHRYVLLVASCLPCPLQLEPLRAIEGPTQDPNASDPRFISISGCFLFTAIIIAIPILAGAILVPPFNLDPADLQIRSQRLSYLIVVAKSISLLKKERPTLTCLASVAQ